MKYLLAMLLSFFFFSTYAASSIPYCKGLQISQVEDQIIQKVVTNFAAKAGCQVGNHCLLKFEQNNNYSKFSIAWAEQCGFSEGVGDRGYGSTFVCLSQEKSCCWPVGFPESIVCSNQ